MLPFTFLICSERSGSNLITKLFDSHPEFCGPSPSHLIRILARNRVRYGSLEKPENWQILCTDAAALLNSQLGQWQHTFTKQELTDQVPEQSLSALIRYVYEQEAKANTKQRLFVKENHTCSFLPFLLATFPDSDFIYLVRDPRDMSLSYKQTLAHTGGVSEAVQVWLRDQQPGIEAYLHLREAGRIHLLTYEHLVADPEKALSEACLFLQVEFDSRMLAFHEHGLTRLNAGRLSAWKNLQRPVLQSNFNKYRNVLSELEIRYIEAACAREMEFFGYKPDFAAGQTLEELRQQLLAYEALNPLTVQQPDARELSIRQARNQALQQVLSRQLPF